jgi:hypothetical protein
MAVLDARTCVICWNLHGRTFNSSLKVFSHPNCRCTMIPVTQEWPRSRPAPSGSRLEPGFQKQILGPAGSISIAIPGDRLSVYWHKKSKEFGLEALYQAAELMILAKGRRFEGLDRAGRLRRIPKNRKLSCVSGMLEYSSCVMSMSFSSAISKFRESFGMAFV